MGSESRTSLLEALPHLFHQRLRSKALTLTLSVVGELSNYKSEHTARSRSGS